MMANDKEISGKRISIRNLFMSWEWMLIIIFIIVNIINSVISPYYLNAGQLLNATTTFLAETFIVFPMVFILILGEIDISVGSTVALSSVIMGVLYKAGLPMAIAILISLAVGIICGLINGLLIVKFNLSSIIVTFTTMTLYRGLCYAILKDQAVGNFPSWYKYFGWGSVVGIPYMLIAFIITAMIYGLLLHKTTFGRYVYSMGNNITASRFSGIKVDKIKLMIFILAGLMSSVTSIFLTSIMGSTRPDVALGYEMDVITMAVFGGVSTAGGKGGIIGPIISIFIIGLLHYGLGLINIPSTTMLIVVGALLIFAVMIANINQNKNSRKN